MKAMPTDWFDPDLCGSQRLVLLADADDTNALFEGAALERLGCRVVRVRDGSSAVALATTGRFDGVLMELRLPLLDGSEATSAIRRFERSSRRTPTPIVALTASVMPDERARCEASGMDAVLPKPVMLDSLARTVAAWPRVGDLAC